MSRLEEHRTPQGTTTKGCLLLGKEAQDFPLPEQGQRGKTGSLFLTRRPSVFPGPSTVDPAQTPHGLLGIGGAIVKRQIHCPVSLQNFHFRNLEAPKLPAAPAGLRVMGPLARPIYVNICSTGSWHTARAQLCIGGSCLTAGSSGDYVRFCRVPISC